MIPHKHTHLHFLRTSHQLNLQNAMDSFISSLFELASSVAAVNTYYEDANDVPDDEERTGTAGGSQCTIA